MNRTETVACADHNLTEVVARVLQLAPEEVIDDTSMDTCVSWDSLRHIELLMAVEAAMGVRFPTGEMPMLRSVGRIRAAIERLSVSAQ